MAARIVTAEEADNTPYSDPFEAQYWNLMQVLAWVYLGSCDVVRDAGTPAAERGHFFEEHTLPDGRQELIKRKAGRFTIIDLGVEQAYRNGSCYPLFRLAEAAVIEALEAGRLTAYGLKNREGDLQEVPSLQWADLKFWYDPDFAGPKEVFRFGATQWHDLRFQRKDVLAIWSDPLNQLDDQAPAEEEPAAPAVPEARAHNKPKTEARNQSWQEDIDKLATTHTETSHTELCRIHAKKIGAKPETIRRNTRRPRR